MKPGLKDVEVLSLDYDGVWILRLHFSHGPTSEIELRRDLTPELIVEKLGRLQSQSAHLLGVEVK